MIDYISGINPKSKNDFTFSTNLCREAPQTDLSSGLILSRFYFDSLIHQAILKSEG